MTSNRELIDAIHESNRINKQHNQDYRRLNNDPYWGLECLWSVYKWIFSVIRMYPKTSGCVIGVFMIIFLVDSAVSGVSNMFNPKDRPSYDDSPIPEYVITRPGFTSQSRGDNLLF